MTALGASDKGEEVKIAILLHTIGEEALEVYNTFTVTTADEDDITMEGVLKTFKDYCSPQKNVVFERHQFCSHVMAPFLWTNSLQSYARKVKTASLADVKMIC